MKGFPIIIRLTHCGLLFLVNFGSGNDFLPDDALTQTNVNPPSNHRDNLISMIY